MKIIPKRAAAAGDAGGWGLDHTVGTKLCPEPSMRSGERAEPPMTKAQSTAPSARSGGLDDLNSGPECGVYT